MGADVRFYGVKLQDPEVNHSHPSSGTEVNNNNNIYKLQLGCHPVAAVILHVHKHEKRKKVTRKFKSGGLHERHVAATWKLGNHLSIRL